MSNIGKSGRGRLKKFENRSLTREFLQQYLIEKENGSLERWSLTGGGRLPEVVATRELTVFELKFEQNWCQQNRFFLKYGKIVRKMCILRPNRDQLRKMQLEGYMKGMGARTLETL